MINHVYHSAVVLFIIIITIMDEAAYMKFEEGDSPLAASHTDRCRGSPLQSF